MGVSILEALQNADFNLTNNLIAIDIARIQLHNAVILLEKGYDVYEEVEPLIDKYGKVENVPEKPEEE